MAWFLQPGPPKMTVLDQHLSCPRANSVETELISLALWVAFYIKQQQTAGKRPCGLNPKSLLKPPNRWGCREVANRPFAFAFEPSEQISRFSTSHWAPGTGTISSCSCNRSMSRSAWSGARWLGGKGLVSRARKEELVGEGKDMVQMVCIILTI